MKHLLFIVLLLAVCSSSYSQGLAPQPVPCFEPYIYTHPTSPGAYSIQRKFAHVSCIDLDYPTPTPGQLITEGATEVVAGESVHLGANVHVDLSGAPPVNIGGGATIPPYFHMHVSPNDFDVMWYEPNNTPGDVGQYEKLELGLRLPNDLQEKINRFVGDSTSGTKINPFDPEQISVEADMYYLGGHYNILGASYQKKIYGFYYKEFERDIKSTYPHWDSIKTNTWAEDTTSFTFRIRFAPPQTGNWAAQIKVITSEGTVYAWPVMFNCADSFNPGFVKVGDNNRFLQLGDESFIPIGTSLATPTCWGCLTPDIPGDEAFNPEPMKSLGFVKYHEEMEDLKNKGGNYFRMLIAPWNTDIEFEKLGDYSKRLNYAWEMDRILDKAKDLDLRIHLNMQFHFTLEQPSFYDFYYWDWDSDVYEVYDPGHIYIDEDRHNIPDPGYCYKTELSLTDPIEFFTDVDAKKHYKNKLRYMLSRWGYSTNIALWELYSEIDNAGGQTPKHIVPHPDAPGYNMVTTNKALPTYSPYWNESSWRTAIEDWQDEMAQFIKQNLDNNHLISADYTGGKNDNFWGAHLDDASYDSPYIDIVSFNYYKGHHINRFKDGVEQVNYRYGEHDKPLMFPEMGIEGMDACDNNTEFIRSLWCSAFLGGAGPGLDYNGVSHDVRNTWQYYQGLKDFLQGNTFATEWWVPNYDLMGDSDPDADWLDDDDSDKQDAEMFALVNRDTDAEAMGVIVNRRWNYYTTGQSSTNCVDSAFAPIPPFNSSDDIESPVFHPLKLHQMQPGSYLVTFYNAITGDIEDIQVRTVYPVIKTLTLDYPTLCMSCTTPTPLMAFKAIRAGGVKSLTIQVDSVLQANDQKDISFEVFPSPATSIVNVQIPSKALGNELTIRNSSGQVVYSNRITDLLVNIDVSVFQSGIYLVSLYEGENVLTHKLIVQHE